MITRISDILSEVELQSVAQLPEVLSAKAKIDSLERGHVDFTIPLSQSLRDHLQTKFGLSLERVAAIPMRWIKGDTPPHKDRGCSKFKSTYLVYLNDGEGEFKIGNQTYPLIQNTGFQFEEGVIHETRATGTTPRLLLGPMNEMAEPVGAQATRQVVSQGYNFNTFTDIATNTTINFTAATLVLKVYPYAREQTVPGTWDRGYYIFYDITIEYNGTTDNSGNEFTDSFTLMDDESWTNAKDYTFICDGTTRTLTVSQSDPLVSTLNFTNNRETIIVNPVSWRSPIYTHILFNASYNDTSVWSFNIPTVADGDFSITETPTNNFYLRVRILPGVDNEFGNINPNVYDIETAFTLNYAGTGELATGNVTLYFTIDNDPPLSISRDFSTDPIGEGPNFTYLRLFPQTAATGNWTVSNINLIVDDGQ